MTGLACAPRLSRGREVFAFLFLPQSSADSAIPTSKAVYSDLATLRCALHGLSSELGDTIFLTALSLDHDLGPRNHD